MIQEAVAALKEIRAECARIADVVVKVSGEIDEQARGNSIRSQTLFDAWRSLKDCEERARLELAGLAPQKRFKIQRPVKKPRKR